MRQRLLGVCFSFFCSRDPWDVSPDQPPPISPTSAQLHSRPARTISNINPPNNKSSLLDNALPCPVAEVSPYRRWSEAVEVVGRHGHGLKVSNEWQSNFELSYIELEELGRGRFSVVRRCQEIMSGNEVAVKFVNRRKQCEVDTLREFRILAGLKHPYIISSMGLYLTSTSYAIVLTL